MSLNYIPPKAHPLFPTMVQPGAPHMSGHETGIAHETQALWYRHSMQRKHFIYPDPSKAPQSTITAANTWTRYLMTDSSTSIAAGWWVPWYVQPRTSRIRVDVYFVALYSAPFRVRAQTDDFVSAVATAYSPASSDTQQLQQFVLPSGAWVQKSATESAGSIYKARLELAPTYDANSLTAISLMCQFTPIVSPFNSSFSFKSYIYAAIVENVFAGFDQEAV